ncbi:MAG: cupin domain-containing protein [Thermoleophilaceae bacterium]|nr:cupin domain-containing protein [Thermoleophilaceae bacterium]
MTVISSLLAPEFHADGTHVIGLASPSRGAKDTSVWRVTLDPGSSSPTHELEREEVFVALSGTATATIDGREHRVSPGDALIVPRDTPFSIASSDDAAFEAVCCLPVGARAMVDGERFTPPWAQ